VHILTYLAQDLPKVEADRVQLQQVILNLVINAMDAMNDTPAEDKRIFLASQKNRHDQVVVRVEDCGVGLPRDACEQIFQPFFTTKPHGIGVGLSICRSIVESHSGQIRAFPRSEGGSVLEFSIPIMAGGLS
jgi:C4-dicarboxylate-specific signal transduction histidine kinase